MDAIFTYNRSGESDVSPAKTTQGSRDQPWALEIKHVVDRPVRATLGKRFQAILFLPGLTLPSGVEHLTDFPLADVEEARFSVARQTWHTVSGDGRSRTGWGGSCMIFPRKSGALIDAWKRWRRDLITAALIVLLILFPKMERGRLEDRLK